MLNFSLTGCYLITWFFFCFVLFFLNLHCALASVYPILDSNVTDYIILLLYIIIPPYGHLSITDSLFGLGNAKNHTSINRTPL